LSVRLGRLAVETGVFPLYEVERGKYKMSLDFPKVRPIQDYLQGQGRFRHLTPDLIEKIQARVLEEYKSLKAKVEMGKAL
jgi:pyruvate ferredoxin oxidoreductase beta subunit